MDDLKHFMKRNILYAHAAWSYHLQKHIQVLENVQRATKLVPEFKTLPYEQRYLIFNRFPTLTVRNILQHEMI